MLQAAPCFTKSRHQILSLEDQQNQFIFQSAICEDLDLNSLTSDLEFNLVCISFTLRSLFFKLAPFIHSQLIFN